MAIAYRFVIENSQEVPPTTANGSGVGVMVFDPASSTANYNIRVTGVTFTAPGTADTPQATGAHFHNAARGANGPVVFGQVGPANDANDFKATPNADGSWTLTGRWDPSDSGAGIAAFATTLGSTAVGAEAPLYFNVHDAAFPAGFMRGQLVAVADEAANTVAGASQGDILYGLGGADSIDGGAGNDLLFGNRDQDVIHGGDGADSLFGGKGDDALYGEAGDDLLSGDLGQDMLFGGDGADRFLMNTGGGDDTAADFNFAAGDRVQVATGTTFTITEHDGFSAVSLSDGTLMVLSGVAPGTATSDYVVQAQV